MDTAGLDTAGPATPRAPDAILLTGGSGYVGGLALCALLARERARVVVPLRPGCTRETFLAPIRTELRALGAELTPGLEARLELVPFPEADAVADLAPVLDRHGVDEIVHCAGCLDYFDEAALERVNVVLTRELLALARRHGVGRFVYVSTSYSSGYLDHPAPEKLHPEPPRDPTAYTRSKRRAEWLVAESGVPFLILRPSILIGDSRDGHYSGKRYGLYQYWMGAEKFLCKRYFETYHAVGPRQPVNLLHQDAFVTAFLAARRHLPANEIMHVVSRNETRPTMREVQELWVEACMRPRTVRYYERVEDVPRYEMDPRQRAFIALASVNLEISGHPWVFETGKLEALRARGMPFADVSLDSIRVCQERFVRDSEPIQRFLSRFGGVMPGRAEREIVEVPRGGAGEETHG